MIIKRVIYILDNMNLTGNNEVEIYLQRKQTDEIIRIKVSLYISVSY